MCVCVCVCVRERERESAMVIVVLREGCLDRKGKKISLHFDRRDHLAITDSFHRPPLEATSLILNMQY